MKNGGQAQSGYLMISQSGKTISGSIQGLEHKLSREVYMPHNELIVFGKELAGQGVQNHMDYFARDPQTRMTLYMFVAEGAGETLLSLEPELEKLPCDELIGILKDQANTSETPIVTGFDFVKALISKTTCPVAPLVRVLDEGERKRLQIEGCAVFKNCKMVGELDDRETRGMLWIKNEIKKGVLQIELKGSRVALNIQKAHSRVVPELRDGGRIVVKIDVREMETIGEQSGTVNFSDPEMIPLLQKASRRAIGKEIRSALEKAKELNADVFCFGDCIRRKYPGKWEKMKDRWDTLFRELDFEITVKTQLLNSGRLNMPLSQQEE
jgi:spore germination protein KC